MENKDTNRERNNPVHDEEYFEDERSLPDDWFDADFDADMEERPAPLIQRKGFRRVVAIIFSLALVMNILAFWPKVYSLAAIQFLIKSRELSQNVDVQRYKESVVIVRTPESKGTGFTIAEDGLIITNHHVIDGGSPVTVVYPDGNLYHAELLLSDPQLDIAILDIEAEDLPVLTLAAQDDETSDLSGAKIYVIGNPLFFNQIANMGEVVGVMKRDHVELLLIDAPIYKGNSGSPVINEEGQVIGVVFATSNVELDGTSTKVGLAIPIHSVQKFLQDLQLSPS